MGRPTKLTPETQKAIVTAIKLGATYEHAAQYGGVSYSAMQKWLKRGLMETERLEKPNTKAKKDEAEFVTFFHAIKEAEGTAVTGWLAKIEKAASDGAWQAAAWKLERRYPGIYGKQVRDINHSGDMKVIIEYVNAD